jgi:hypothetical protein
MAQVFMMNSIKMEPEAEKNPKITNPQAMNQMRQPLSFGLEVLLTILATAVGCFGLLLLAWCLG